MLKKFFFVTGVFSIILVILNIILYGTAGFDFLFLLGILLALLLLLYPKYEASLSLMMVKFINWVLMISSIIIYGVLILVGIFIIVNLPKDEPGAAEIPTIERSADASKNYLQLCQISTKNNVRFAEKMGEINRAYQYDVYDSAKVEKIITEIQPSQEEFMNFLANSSITAPEKLNWETPVPSFPYVQNSFRFELFLIGKHIENNEYDMANAKYQRLWKSVDNLFAGKNLLIVYIIDLVLVDELMNFYKKYPNQFEFADQEELLTHVNQINENLYPAFEYAVKFEDITLKNGFDPEEKEFLGFGTSFGWNTILFVLGEERLSSWPLYDYHKTMETFTKIHEMTMQIGTQPMYEMEASFEEYLNSLENFVEPSLVKNPVGSLFVGKALPDYQNVIIRKEQRKSELTAFIYVLNNMKNDDLPEPPVDNLSGTPFPLVQEEEMTLIHSEKDREIVFPISIK